VWLHVRLPQERPGLIGIRCVVLSVLLLCCTNAFAEGFQFAGLDLRTPPALLKKRYPRSSVVGNYIYVSAADSHDHIYGIQMPHGDQGRRLRLFFERPERARAQHTGRYPSCRKVLSRIAARYGGPAETVDSVEEKSLNRRFTWKKDRESLALHCFRVNTKSFLAEALTIAEAAR
jgi:hypothetical protein